MATRRTLLYGSYGVITKVTGILKGELFTVSPFGSTPPVIMMLPW